MDITITRDRWGIAHVDAPDAAAAFEAQGYCAATDRFWQMEYDRLKAAGRWSEVVGAAGVREDTFFRRIGIERAARRDWAGLSDEAKAMTEAYARGVNRWLADHGDDLPAEFEHHPFGPAAWEPWHCSAVYKVRHVFMGTLMRKLWRGAVLRAAGPELTAAMRGEPGRATPIVPSAGSPIDLLDDAARALAAAAEDLAGVPDVDGASNSWAIHGSRTATGSPLLAGDPHRGIEFPNVYLQFHMACDTFDVIGLSFPGVPGFAHFGHNADVAWCITHAMADDTDVFVESPDAVVDRRTETVIVRDAEPVRVTTGATPRGPYVLGDLDGGGAVLSLDWTGLTADSTFECLAPMLTARSCDELEGAVRQWVIPANSLLTADTGGNISFKVRGRIIERPPANRWTPVPGDDTHGWDGLEPVPFERLPHWRNPDRGFLVTANNRISDDGPYISLDFAGPARHDRIVQLLTDLESATLADMTTVHADVRSLAAPAIIAVIDRLRPRTDAARDAQRMLRDWDHEVTAESPAAVVYHAVRHAWAGEVAARLGLDAPEFGEPGWPRAIDASRMHLDASLILLTTGGWDLLPGLATQADLDAALGALLDDVVADLAADHGPDPSAWRWRDHHVMVSPHPLALGVPAAADLHPPEIGVAGDGETVRAGSVAPLLGMRCYAGSCARYAFDIGDWDNSGWIVPHGVSGVRGSGHDLDQREAWSACELIPMAYSTEAVAAVARSTETLTIG
ncbi:MAG: penicillin acylase family protein [Actinomycetota bacterium]